LDFFTRTIERRFLGFRNLIPVGGVAILQRNWGLAVRASIAAVVEEPDSGARVLY
jgi:hypothetical protein